MIRSSSSYTLADQQHIVLDNVSWDLYEQLLSDLDGRPIRVTFDNGDLEMMAPLPLHEKWKTRLGRLIEAMSEELDIDIEPLGSTTFRREDLSKGLEPDECYYISHAASVRGKDELDLTVDPPPDLAVEVDITHRSIRREPIYAALGVPELWRFDGLHLKVLVLRDGTYDPSPTSTVFPFLRLTEFESFLLRLDSERRPTVVRDFRSWLRTLGFK